MGATYEVWLLDDSGARIRQIEDFFFMSYSRVVQGLGVCQIGLSYDAFISQVQPYFSLDRRLEIWRSPAEGIVLRRDATFLLREPRIYSRESDGMRVIEFFGRSPIDLLGRRVIPQYAGSSYTTKTDQIDDMMNAIIRENALFGSAVDETGVVDNDRAFPQYEFSVQADRSLGPSITLSFADTRLMDTLEKLRDISFQKNADNSSNRKIYFDVVPDDLNNYVIYILDADGEIFLDEAGDGILDETSFETLSPIGFQFRTIADRFGQDITDTIEFSEENGNFEAPSYLKSHMEEVNAVYVKGQGEGFSRMVETVVDQARIDTSRWNRMEDLAEASNETLAAGLQSVGNERLGDKEPREDLYGTFLNVPEGPDNPSSLYGLDWDLGDLVKIKFAGQYFEAEIKTIHVSVNADGENILGRNVVE